MDGLRLSCRLNSRRICGHRRSPAAFLVALLTVLSCATAFAGGGRHNVLLVVNENSAVSRAIGEHYRSARKIPAANVCRIRCTAGESINSTDFKNAILYPIENYLTAHNLVEQIQYIVLTKGIPLIVTSTGNSVDSSLTLAFQRWTDGVTPCIEGAGNPYVGKETGFADFRASDANKVFWNDPRSVNDIAASADGAIFAVGGQYIARSDDGVNWQNISEEGCLGVLTELTRACFSDDGNGWAVGVRESILKTTDGGKTWKRTRGGPSSPDVLLKGVWFTSEKDGWIVGRDQRGAPLALRSGDGGDTWMPQSVGAAAELNDVFFADRRNGWIVGDGDMMRTTDGGDTWTPARNGVPNGSLTRVFFADSRYGWVCGYGMLLCRTTDGGRTWSRVRIEGMLDQNITDCHFINRKVGWIVTTCGYDSADESSWSGRLLYTDDGGLTWSTVRSGEQDRQAVYFANEKTGWFAQPNSDEQPWRGVIYRTSDGGRSTERVYTTVPYSVRLMYLVCRLDAYGRDTAGGGNGVPDDVEAMIAASLSPDTTGRFVMDESAGNYPVGNEMLARTAAALGERGRDVLCDTEWGFVTGACPGLGPVAGYAGWGSNDGASKWNTEWAKPSFSWKPGSIAMCFVSTDGRSLDEPPAYLRCSANSIVDEGQAWGDPGSIRIYGWVYSGWTARLHAPDGSVVSSACFEGGTICLPCSAPVEGYIQIYRPDGVTPVCGARFPASGTAALSGGRAYRFATGQSLIADYLAEGCSGAIGSVSEPLFGNTWPEYTFPRYVDGFTWAESAWMGIAATPWTFIVAGDPLMAPYATPPSVAIVRPSAGEAALRGIVEVEIAASDDKGISKVELWVDDRFRGTASGAGPTYTISLDTASLADGYHTIEAIAYEAGAVATQGSASRRVITVNGNRAASVADLFDVPGGSWVYVRSAVVTRVFPSYGCFYVQEGRAAGIKVVAKDMPADGDVVSVAGIMLSGKNVERCIEAKSLSIVSRGGALPRPIGFTNRLLGGGSMRTAAGITSPSRSLTLYNIGLLSTIWGRVVSVGEDYFYLSDGSDEIGVRVMCHEFAPPFGVGEMVRATGVSSMIAGYRALLVGRSGDIGLLSPTNP